MTESEWLTATDPTPMMLFLRGNVSDRKLRLAAVAVARLLSHRLPEDIREAVGVGERVADGLAGKDEQVPFVDKLYRLSLAEDDRTGGNWFRDAPPEDVSAVFSAIRAVGCGSPNKDVSNSPAWQLTLRATSERQPPILRDIFGNPFRPVSVNPDWRTPSVVALAEGIYADRAFDRMPVLADALEDAGCDNADILNHCRGDSPHVRGCWVVDFLLGKE